MVKACPKTACSIVEKTPPSPLSNKLANNGMIIPSPNVSAAELIKISIMHTPIWKNRVLGMIAFRVCILIYRNNQWIWDRNSYLKINPPLVKKRPKLFNCSHYLLVILWRAVSCHKQTLHIELPSYSLCLNHYQFLPKLESFDNFLLTLSLKLNLQ